jgi:hypothetical protein
VVVPKRVRIFQQFEVVLNHPCGDLIKVNRVTPTKFNVCPAAIPYEQVRVHPAQVVTGTNNVVTPVGYSHGGKSSLNKK